MMVIQVVTVFWTSTLSIYMDNDNDKYCDNNDARVEVSPLKIAKRCKICGEFE